MTNGWIKLHRQIQESPFYTNSVAVHVWLECLLRAAHDERSVYMKRERITLLPGQFVMGREEFGRTIGVSPTTAWYWITQFSTDSMIDIKKTSKGSLVTVKNWVEYQKFDSTSDSEKPADEQPTDTNKKDKNVKNEKKLMGVSVEVVDPVEAEFRQAIPIIAKSLEKPKVFTPAALEKWRARRRAFSAQELVGAFVNLQREPDRWKITNNGWRELAWWLHTDARIIEMQNCHLKGSGKATIHVKL